LSPSRKEGGFPAQEEDKRPPVLARNQKAESGPGPPRKEGKSVNGLLRKRRGESFY